MKWFSNITRWLYETSRRDDPNISPFTARCWVALHLALASALMPYIVGISHGLAVYGTLLVIFGSGVLWWETIATPPDLQRLISDLARMEISPKLSFADGGYLAIVFQPIILIVFILGGVIWLAGKQNPNSLVTSLWLLIILLVGCYVCIPMLSSFLMKASRRWFTRRSNRIRGSQDPIAETKIFLRFIGFVSLWVGGSLQLLAILLSHH
jgi:hypothetical protein